MIVQQKIFGKLISHIPYLFLTFRDLRAEVLFFLPEHVYRTMMFV